MGVYVYTYVDTDQEAVLVTFGIQMLSVVVFSVARTRLPISHTMICEVRLS